MYVRSYTRFCFIYHHLLPPSVSSFLQRWLNTRQWTNEFSSSPSSSSPKKTEEQFHFNTPVYSAFHISPSLEGEAKLMVVGLSVEEVGEEGGGMQRLTAVTRRGDQIWPFSIP